MLHNIPAVIVNSKKPIALMRPGQKAPERDFEQVALEIDQGLVLTRMVVVNNAKEVAKLGRQIRMDGGTGNMVREVQRFSPSIKKAGLALIEASIPFLDASKAFGKKSGDVGDITSAGGVMLGQLGTPVDTVRYLPIMVDEKGQPLQGDKAYTFTVPAGLVEESGSCSMTAYGTDNRLLIPNARKVYAQTTYSAVPIPMAATQSPSAQTVPGRTAFQQESRSMRFCERMSPCRMQTWQSKSRPNRHLAN